MGWNRTPYFHLMGVANYRCSIMLFYKYRGTLTSSDEAPLYYFIRLSLQ